MTTLDTRIKSNAEYAASKLNLAAQFIAAWWISENGWTWPSDNNPGNISFTGDGVPSGGVFDGVTSVESNRVCVYGSDQAGIDAFIELLLIPKGPDKALSIDIADLLACGGDVSRMAEVVGNSNWAESHYDSGTGAGSLILGVYNSDALASAFAEVSTPTIDPANPIDTPEQAAGHDNSFVAAGDTTENYRRVHYVTEGDTLSVIALRYQVSVDALAILNNLADPNVITIGQRIGIPDYYRVQPGDTVSAIAEKYGDTVDRLCAINKIDPNYIETGWGLFV